MNKMNVHTIRNEPALPTLPKVVKRNGVDYYMEEAVIEDHRGFTITKKFLVRLDNPEPRLRAYEKAESYAEARGMIAKARVWQPADWTAYRRMMFEKQLRKERLAALDIPTPFD